MVDGLVPMTQRVGPRFPVTGTRVVFLLKLKVFRRSGPVSGDGDKLLGHLRLFPHGERDGGVLRLGLPGGSPDPRADGEYLRHHRELRGLPLLLRTHELQTHGRNRINK